MRRGEGSGILRRPRVARHRVWLLYPGIQSPRMPQVVLFCLGLLFSHPALLRQECSLSGEAGPRLGSEEAPLGVPPDPEL